MTNRSNEVTRRNMMQEDLHSSETRYRRLFESARDGILILDAASRKITDVNPYMVELLGYSYDEFLGKELWEIGLFKDKDESRTAFRELQATGYIRYEDMPLQTKVGKRWDVEFVSNVYTEGDRQVIQCNIRDITARKLSEAALLQADAKYRSIVESLPAIVYLTQPYPPYSMTYISPNVTELGYSTEEWFSRPHMRESLLHEEDRERVVRETGVAMNQGLEVELEYRIVSRDGTVNWVRDKGRFILDEQGDRTSWQGVMLDITKTKALEEQLRQTQKLESVGRLAGGIAHDFNNMLTAINGYSELTLRQLEADSPLRHNLEEIRKAGERSALLTHQLLAFSRKQILQPKVLYFNQLLADTGKMLQRLIGEDIRLVMALNSKVGPVNVDPGQLTQVLTNLVVNARDAMPKGGSLTIESANVYLDAEYAHRHISVTPGEYVMLAVSDTGTGMDEETQRQIFEPFFTTKEVGQGTGLGLATVYGIVKQSGGNIGVYSEVEHGTTFKIYLPRVAEIAGVTEVRDASDELPRGTETILLVEDEELVRKLVSETLKMCGYNVLEAANGEEGFSIYEEQYERQSCEIDLLMTDVVMPLAGGRELAKRLAPLCPRMRILFMSGYTDDAVVRHGVIEAGANFIQKPFTLDALAKKIRQILDKTPRAAGCGE